MLKRGGIMVFIFPAMVLLAATAFANGKISDDKIWREIGDSALKQRNLERQIIPDDYKTFRLNKTALLEILNSAPLEFTNGREVILTLPMPDGSFSRFRIERSPVVEAGLSAKYPELANTFRGQGIDDPTATVRFDMLPMGFHAMIISANGRIYIDPYAKGDTTNYISYDKRAVRRTGNEPFCLVDGDIENFGLRKIDIPTLQPTPEVTSGTQLRTYRLALAATNEYTVAVGGNTVAGALAAQVLVMNRVNGVYEREVAIRMNIVANNNLIVYAGDNNTCGGQPCNSGNDPYTNSSGSTMLGQNQTNLDTVIGSANYDIGHVFSTGGGGVASLSVPCGGSKARGVTGLSNPVGDDFSIDYVAHEMGHQWGANHTFNGASGNCSGGNRSAANSYEPGSGITIMAYAGICGSQNLAAHSIDTFHVRSLEAIVAYSQTGNGNTCAAITNTGNTPPSVSVVGGNTFNIPKQTPFTLTASGSDVNGDTITYDWQQYNTGGTTGTTAIPNTDSDGTSRPIFRPYLPVTDPSRTFPSLQYILNNANVPPSTTSGFLTGELLPAITRTMTFQVIARDNRANGGGINTATATVNVNGNSGPFVITAPNTSVSWTGSSSQTVTWDVANTSGAPINAANVKISLSTDGGQTFPITILDSTPNDGTQLITVPNIPTTVARIKVEAVGNIFFDISDTNFTITQGSQTRAKFVDFDGDRKTDISIYRPSVGQWWYQRSSDMSIPAFEFGMATDKIVPEDYDGDGKTDIAFWRPSTGEWFVLRSSDFSFFAAPFGSNGDIPAPGDYDGDNKADLAVFRASSGTWFINKSSGGVQITPFGANGDVPVIADYDNDGKSDIAIFRPNGNEGNAEWWTLKSTGGVFATPFGSPTDKPVQGDYTGDGKADCAFFRPSTGEWFVLRSEDLSFYSAPFGQAGDIPAPGDYDGDNKNDLVVFRPTGAMNWFIQKSTGGVSILGFGVNGDQPVPSAYVP